MYNFITLLDHVLNSPFPIENFPSPPRAWAEISIKNFLHNLSFARQCSDSRVMAVLKAGAYGHGMVKLAEALDEAEIAFFGVASVAEARQINDGGIKGAIYLLGPTFPEEREEVVNNRWVPSLSNLIEARHFNDLNRGKEKLAVHITVDTGMGRGGFTPDQVLESIDEILTLENLAVEGVGSHLPSADEDRDFTLTQFKTFDDLVKILQELHDFKFIHLSNSAGALDYKSETTNLIRPGLMLYGISPLKKYQTHLKPVMTLKSRVSLVRQLSKGQGVSYGRTCILESDTLVATVGIGYGDGYSRLLSGKGIEVLIRGEKCKVLGRVTMDQIMVDVSHLSECSSGDEVELFGETILVTELAEKANLIPWEIFTGITPRVTRLYL